MMKFKLILISTLFVNICGAFTSTFRLTFPDIQHVKVVLKDGTNQPIIAVAGDSSNNGKATFTYSTDHESMGVLWIEDIEKKSKFGVIIQIEAGDYELTINLPTSQIPINIATQKAPNKTKLVIGQLLENNNLSVQWTMLNFKLDSLQKNDVNDILLQSLSDSIHAIDSVIFYRRSIFAVQHYDIAYSFATLGNSINKLYNPKYSGAIKNIHTALEFGDKPIYPGNKWYIENLRKQLDELEHPTALKKIEGVLSNQYGQTKSLTDSIVNYRIICFWASWCGPCVKEIPDLKQLEKTFTSKGVSIYNISIDKDTVKWKSAIDRYQLYWPQLIDVKDNSLHDKYGVREIPNMLLIDKQGNILLKTALVAELEKRLLALTEKK